MGRHCTAPDGEYHARMRVFPIPSVSLRDLVAVWLPIAALVLAAFWLTTKFIKPAPPRTLVMSTGSPQGAYHTFAEQYRRILARNGIALELRPSEGATDNLTRLLARTSEVDVALVQSGLANTDNAPGLETLGSAFYEPVWVFHRERKAPERLAQLVGKRIAIGAEGSGTRKLALELLGANDLDETNTKLFPYGGVEAGEKLLTGEIDVAIFVAAPETGIIRSLLYTSGVQLMSFERAAAYTRLFPYLSMVTVPQGSINLARDIPARDTQLLAATAHLLVRDTLHPALGSLLVQTLAEVHGRPGPIAKLHEFPASRDADLPLADEAARYYKSGPPFLQRYLPFWAAALADRAVILLVPFFAVLLPALRLGPPLYSWRVRRKISRWYGELKFLEHEMRTAYEPTKEPEYTRRLEELEDKAYERPIPLAYTDQVYTLREHIELVRRILANRKAGRAPDAEPMAN